MHMQDGRRERTEDGERAERHRAKAKGRKRDREDGKEGSPDRFDSIYSCPKPIVSSTAKVSFCSIISILVYGGRSMRLKHV